MLNPLGRVEVYFKLNRILLSLIGNWPQQTLCESRFATGMLLIVTMSQLIPQLAGFAKVIGDMDEVIECLPPLGIAGLCAIKLTNLLANKYETKNLVRTIQKDWESAISETEIGIMQRYAKYSNKLSRIYAIVIYTAGALFIVQPAIEGPTATGNQWINGTTEYHKRLPFVAEYLVDTDEYFYHIIFHAAVTTFAFMTIFVAADSIFVVYVQHGCAKFELLKYRLGQVIEPGDLDVDIQPGETYDLGYQRVQTCVRQHNEAIEFVRAVESSYRTCQLFQVCLCCVLMSFTGLHAVTKLGKPGDVMRYFGAIFGLILQLLFYSLPSHELMDQSVSVCEATYNTEWYRASIRTRKLLLQMMTRSLDTCRITAGRMFVMSMETFCKILSNSMSYFTMLTSMQE